MAKDAMAVIVGLVAEPLSRHPRMTEADGLVVQLVITFFRNLLTIPDRAATGGLHLVPSAFSTMLIALDKQQELLEATGVLAGKQEAWQAVSGSCCMLALPCVALLLRSAAMPGTSALMCPHQQVRQAV